MKAEDGVIYIVDDDPAVRKSVERLLRGAGYPVETFGSAAEFLERRHENGPGCLVLDVQMPDLSGIELQQHLARLKNSLPIVFITAHGTIPVSVQAMKGGAVDFLEKPFNSEALLKAISKALVRARRVKTEEHALEKLRGCMDTLTRREQQVFSLVTLGMLNKQIASRLGTAEKTIKAHRANVMQKMGAKSLADLVRVAEKLGIHHAISE